MRRSVVRPLRRIDWRPATPPMPIGWYRPAEAFWLLPGVYHAHAFGFVMLHGMIAVAKCKIFWLSIFGGVVGIGFLSVINWHYARKFIQTRRDPCDISRLAS